MNDLSAPVRQTDRNGQEILRAVVDPDTRISLLDRLSLRLGLWLLPRSTRRIRRMRSHVDHQRLRERQRLAQERERFATWAQLDRGL